MTIEELKAKKEAEEAENAEFNESDKFEEQIAELAEKNRDLAEIIEHQKEIIESLKEESDNADKFEEQIAELKAELKAAKNENKVLRKKGNIPETLTGIKKMKVNKSVTVFDIPAIKASMSSTKK